MSNRLFQGIIHQMRDAVDRVIGVIDDNGVIVACSELVKIGEVRTGLREEFSFSVDVVVSGGYTYRPIGSGARVEYAIIDHDCVIEENACVGASREAGNKISVLGAGYKVAAGEKIEPGAMCEAQK